eukprot:scaffold184651_cov21-Tisochrysis_lutea.AAC.1
MEYSKDSCTCTDMTVMHCTANGMCSAAVSPSLKLECSKGTYVQPKGSATALPGGARGRKIV